MTDRHQSPQHTTFLERHSWHTTILPTNHKNTQVRAHWRHFPLTKLGILKLQHYEVPPTLQSVRELQNELNVILIVVEPGQVKDSGADEVFRKALGVKSTADFFLPTRTRNFDLTQTVAELEKALHINVRRSLKRASKLHTEFRAAEQWSREELLKFQELAKSSNKRWPLSEAHYFDLLDAYKGHCHLGVTSDPKTGEWVSGVLLLHTGDTMAYFCAWTSELGRKAQAHTKTVWESLLYSKALKLKVFDFEGEYDPRYPRKSWKGFSAFKAKFGGKVVEYPGCFLRWNFVNFLPKGVRRILGL